MILMILMMLILEVWALVGTGVDMSAANFDIAIKPDSQCRRMLSVATNAGLVWLIHSLCLMIECVKQTFLTHHLFHLNFFFLNLVK